MALSAKQTPQAVTVITHQHMRDRDISTLKEALDSTVGVSTRNFDRGWVNYSARGFGIDKYQVDGMNVSLNGTWVTGETTIDTALFEYGFVLHSTPQPVLLS